MKSRFSAASAASLVLLLATVALWARSAKQTEVLGFYTPTGHVVGVASDHSGVLFFASNARFDADYDLSTDRMSISAVEFHQVHDWLFDKRAQKLRIAGFQVAAGAFSRTISHWKYGAIIVPYWALLIVLIPLPARYLSRVVIRWRRRRLGRCIGCGYDLRKSTERCPECGKRVDPERPAKSPGKHALLSARRRIAAITFTAVIIILVLGLLHGGGRAQALPARELTAILNSDLGRVDLTATMRDAVSELQQASGHQIAVDWQSLDQLVDPDAPVIIHLAGPTLAGALNVLFSAERTDVQQEYSGRGPLMVTAPSRVPLEFRWYQVGDLLAPTQPGNISPGASIDSERDQLEWTIMDVARAEDWVLSGGHFGNIRFVADRMLVLQTPQGHASVTGALQFLRNILSTQSAATMPTQPAASPSDLTLTIPELRVDGITLEEAIDAIADISHANIIVRWTDLKEAGVERQTKIKLRLWDTSVGGALGALLSNAAPDAELAYAVHDGIIVVSSAERINHPSFVSISTRVYDVRDLVDAEVASSKTEPLPATQSTRVSWKMPPSSPLTRDEAVSNLIRTIEEIVDADSWKDNGGNLGTARWFAGCLIINQTTAAHRQIEALLRTLRSGGSKAGADILNRVSAPLFQTF